MDNILKYEDEMQNKIAEYLQTRDENVAIEIIKILEMLGKECSIDEEEKIKEILLNKVTTPPNNLYQICEYIRSELSRFTLKKEAGAHSLNYDKNSRDNTEESIRSVISMYEAYDETEDYREGIGEVIKKLKLGDEITCDEIIRRIRKSERFIGDKQDLLMSMQSVALDLISGKTIPQGPKLPDARSGFLV